MFKWKSRDLKYATVDANHRRPVTSSKNDIHDIHQARKEAIKWMEEVDIALHAQSTELPTF